MASQPISKRVALIKKDDNGRPVLHASSLAEHGNRSAESRRLAWAPVRPVIRDTISRRDAHGSRRTAANATLGPDHPQKEIYEESKHGVAFRDLKDHMNLDAHSIGCWARLHAGPDLCHLPHVGPSRNGGKVTHDPGERISWTNRPPVSLVMDTDENGEVIKETDPGNAQELIASSWQDKRQAMKHVCLHCHTENYVNAFYKQYDDFVINYNEKFAKPGKKIMAALREQELITKPNFDEEIEWTWFYLWHHEGRRARHGASMMAPDYAHWHGMYEVAERFYQELIPQAREIAHHAEEEGKPEAAEAVLAVIDDILDRPEHEWFRQQKKLADEAAANTKDVAAPAEST